MKFKKLCLPLLVISSFLVTSCSSEEDKEEDPYADRHPDFFPREDFVIKKGFDYYSHNLLGYEDIKRSKEEMDMHRPVVLVEEKGQKVVLSFPEHPHEPNHYWAWVEVIDKNGTEFYEEIDEPSEKVKKFEFTVVPEKAFRHKIRVRAFCHVHGEFQDYVILKDYEGKSIIDR